MSKKFARQTVVVWPLSVLILLFWVFPIRAQTGTGTLMGVATDSSGGTLPGVSVVIRNEATNTARTATTNDSGIYRVPVLQPGSYEVEAKLAGFKTLVNFGVVLTIGEIRTVDLPLSLGAISEIVVVRDRRTLLDTEDSQLSSLVDHRRLRDLPLNGRNVYSLATLQPGVIPAMSSIANAEGSSAFFAAGSRFRGNNFTLDGQTNNDESVSGVPVVTPTVEAVQEFRVIRNNFSAEFGTHSGSVINVVTKSGSNQFHGSVWEFHRNVALDAGEVFDPWIPDPLDPTTGKKNKAPLIQNQFGFTFGGPVVGDRLFFFGSYEGFRRRGGESQRIVVETPEFRQWVITNNPSSIAAQLFGSFPGPAPTRNIQTTADLDPASVSFIDPAMPPADLPVLGEVDTFASSADDFDQFSLRLDSVFNEGRDLFFGRYFATDFRVPDATSRSAFGDDEVGMNQSANLTLVHEFSPTLVNEARVGYLYLRSGVVPGSNPEVPAIIIDGPAGIQGAGGVNGFPAAFGSLFVVPQFFKRHTFQWQDIVSINRGNHWFRTGIDVRRLHENGNFGDRSRPFFIYQGVFDFANDAPFMLQAGVDPLTGALTDTPRSWRSTEVGWFIQDDWKLHPRLTLNLGIRWEYFRPITEEQGRLANIIFPDTGGYFERIANAKVGVVDELYKSDLNNFAPRIGFAWDFLGDGKTVLRGGYGVFYEKLFFNIIGNARFNPPFYGRAQLSPFFGDQIQPFLGSDPNDPFGGFSGTVIPGADLGLDENGGIQGVRTRLRVVDPSLRDSYMQNLFLGIQRQLVWNTVVEINYQGTLGRKLPFFGDPNRFTGDLLGDADPLGRFAGDMSENRLNASFDSFNLRQNRVTSNYHGVNMQLSKRFSQGLAFQIAYTFGKAMDYGSDFFGAGENSGGLVGQSFRTYFSDPLNIGLDYGRSAFDIRHRFVTNFLWEIPFMRDQSGALGQILGGWQLGGILAIQSGLPFGVVNGGRFPAGDYNADAQEGDRPDTPSFGNTFSDTPSTSEFINGVFQTSDFPSPAPGSSGNLGKNTFTGPAFRTLDLSLLKNFRLPMSEDSRLQFRAEFFNLFNRVNLYLPNINLNGSFFGKSTQAFDAREIQFALKVFF
ncbi:MAG: carboxypeptidase regulatory-like domain-containing protein [Acidobacteria bacterium]|nr:carboxypeptidase regulatory-like domain-containing protein [Acidobacteriota bacterium]